MRWIALVALVTAVGLLGAGCGGEDANGNQGTAQTSAAMEDESGAVMNDESDAAMKDESMSEEAAMKSDASASAAKGRLIKAVGSEYGQVVADGKGEAFYVFGKEKLGQEQVLRDLRQRLATGADQRQAPCRQRGQGEPARHDQAGQWQAAGDL